MCLKNSEDGNVEINIYGYPAAAHGLVHVEAVDLLPADDGEDEEHVGGQGHDLHTHHKDEGYAEIFRRSTTYGNALFVDTNINLVDSQ